jgi:hypothetical protein
MAQAILGHHGPPPLVGRVTKVEMTFYSNRG